MSKKSVLSSKKSGSKPKKSYPPEVREKAVKLITELGYSVSDVAQQLGCSTAAVRRWKEAATPLDPEGERLSLWGDLRRLIHRHKSLFFNVLPTVCFIEAT